MITAADILKNKTRRLITASKTEPIYQVLEKMTEVKIGAILVTDKDENDIVGIWTERDLMRNILMPDFNVRTAPVGEYMTSPLHAASHDATLEELKDMLLGLYIRHILVKKDEKYIGILSVGDLVRASLLAQDEHIRQLKAKTSWHYYENWGWKRKER